MKGFMGKKFSPRELLTTPRITIGSGIIKIVAMVVIIIYVAEVSVINVLNFHSHHLEQL